MTVADNDAAAPTLDSSAHPCGSCGESVPTRQEYCGQCGARQPAVADTAVTAPTLPDVASPPLDLAAMTAAASALVGKPVVFRSLARRERELRAEPDPDAPSLPNFLVGRCIVAAARGAWVLVLHSTGARGWCPVSSVKPRRARRTAPSAAEALAASPAAISMIDALERLYALHTSGGLTDDEFTRAKRTLLDNA